jgi:hypothetical protein
MHSAWPARVDTQSVGGVLVIFGQKIVLACTTRQFALARRADTSPNRKLSAASPSPRPPEKRDCDDQDHRGGKQEVSPRLPLAPRRLSNKMVRMFSHHV